MKTFTRILAVAILALGLIAAVAPQGALACSSGGVQVSGVWAGLAGVSGNCIGGNGVNPIFALIAIFITLATGVLGLVMVLMIIIAGLQYVVSNGSPDVVRAAKDRIRNVMTGFILFVLMWGILHILLPPGSGVFQ